LNHNTIAKSLDAIVASLIKSLHDGGRRHEIQTQ
jgi:hypothetical protein